MPFSVVGAVDCVNSPYSIRWRMFDEIVEGLGGLQYRLEKDGKYNTLKEFQECIEGKYSCDSFVLNFFLGISRGSLF